MSLAELRGLAARALIGCRTSPENAAAVAHALVAADADGIASHGVSRLAFYADQALSGKVDGFAQPTARLAASAVVRVDARDGFAYPAIRLGVERALAQVETTGIVWVGIGNSHHAGVCGYHVEQVAARGKLALAFANTPSGMAPWGGRRGTFGTNPIAFACPRTDSPPLVIDLSLSRVARGKVMLAKQRGEAIPEGWALDAGGRPTTDPDAALDGGTMVPIGMAKGAALALMVEILTAGLSASQFAFEAGSFFTADGAPPRVSQSFLIIDAQTLAGPGFAARVETLFEEILDQEGTRLPGDRRLASRDRAEREGVAIPMTLLDDLNRRAG